MHQQPPNNIVGHCPSCGAPIYTSGVLNDKQVPSNVYSCECRVKTTQKSAPMIKTGMKTGHVVVG